MSKSIKKHWYLDEAGDTTFFGKGRVPILGQNGVSRYFILGMVTFHESVDSIRTRLVELQKSIENDPYYEFVPSVQKRIRNGGFFFHGKEDPAEIRKTFYDFLRTIDCTFEAVVCRKIPSVFYKKHHTKDGEFYGDLLSHLMKTKIGTSGKIVMNIAERGTSTKNFVLESSLRKSAEYFGELNPDQQIVAKVVFNVQQQNNEPLLNVADYFCWALQRKFEREEIRYFEFMKEKVGRVEVLYEEFTEDEKERGPQLH